MNIFVALLERWTVIRVFCEFKPYFSFKICILLLLEYFERNTLNQIFRPNFWTKFGILWIKFLSYQTTAKQIKNIPINEFKD